MSLFADKLIQEYLLGLTLIAHLLDRCEHLLRLNVLDTPIERVFEVRLVKERLDRDVESLIVEIGVLWIDLFQLVQCVVVQELVVLLDFFIDVIRRLDILEVLEVLRLSQWVDPARLDHH